VKLGYLDFYLDGLVRNILLSLFIWTRKIQTHEVSELKFLLFFSFIIVLGFDLSDYFSVSRGILVWTQNKWLPIIVAVRHRTNLDNFKDNALFPSFIPSRVNYTFKQWHWYNNSLYISSVCKMKHSKAFANVSNICIYPVIMKSGLLDLFVEWICFPYCQQVLKTLNSGIIGKCYVR
jgi:hypothetical protein